MIKLKELKPGDLVAFDKVPETPALYGWDYINKTYIYEQNCPDIGTMLHKPFLYLGTIYETNDDMPSILLYCPSSNRFYYKYEYMVKPCLKKL